MTDARRSDWTIDEVQALFELPLMALVRRAGGCTNSSVARLAVNAVAIEKRRAPRAGAPLVLKHF